jgi:hypothetical protein
MVERQVNMQNFLVERHEDGNTQQFKSKWKVKLFLSLLVTCAIGSSFCILPELTIQPSHNTSIRRSSNANWQSSGSKKPFLPNVRDFGVIVTVGQNNLLKTRLQGEKSKINLPGWKFFLRTGHLSDQAVNFRSKTIMPLF